MNLHFFRAISEHCKFVKEDDELDIIDCLSDGDNLTLEEGESLLSLDGKRNAIQVLLCMMIEDEQLYREFVQVLMITGYEDIAFKLMAEELIHHPIYH